MRFPFLLLAGLVLAAQVHAAPIPIVAAENFYGDIASEIGGGAVSVSSILSNPDQDPHQFEASVSTARKLADARIVIYNGAGYDPWAVKLLGASRSAKRQVIEVAALAHRKDGDNPHLWYDVNAIQAVADALTGMLAQMDPVHRPEYEARHAAFAKRLEALKQRISSLRARFEHTPVTATEPVFGYMADAIGLDMRNLAFQVAIMNDTEPSASQIAAFEQDLRQRRVQALIYNSQTTEGLTRRLQDIAKASGVPLVSVTETMPPEQHYAEWMESELDALQQALTAK